MLSHYFMLKYSILGIKFYVYNSLYIFKEVFLGLFAIPNRPIWIQMESFISRIHKWFTCVLPGKCTTFSENSLHFSTNGRSKVSLYFSSVKIFSQLHVTFIQYLVSVAACEISEYLSLRQISKVKEESKLCQMSNSPLQLFSMFFHYHISTCCWLLHPFTYDWSLNGALCVLVYHKGTMYNLY